MTDSTRMVDLPWIDGTTRTVPEWTAYERIDGTIVFARDGGFSYERSEGSVLNAHYISSVAVRIFTEAPEPPVKVDVPTGIGAIVSTPMFPDLPGQVLTRDGWRGLGTYSKYEPSEIGWRLRNGARVLYEGVDESLDE